MKDEIKVEVVSREECEGTDESKKEKKSGGFSRFVEKAKEVGLKAEAKIEKGIKNLADECKEWLSDNGEDDE